jgi:hypothetical protein
VGELVGLEGEEGVDGLEFEGVGSEEEGEVVFLFFELLWSGEHGGEVGLGTGRVGSGVGRTLLVGGTALRQIRNIILLHNFII